MPPTLADASNDLLRCLVWAITQPYLRAIGAGKLAATPEVWAARGSAKTVGDVAVIPVMGVLTQRGGYYGMSVEGIRAQLRGALADGGTRAIVLEFDSPGGEVFGIDELASEIRAARQTKPVVAIANSQADSAAYYLAAQASEVYVTPSGEIGSVGVYGVHEDWSRALDQLGVTVTFISAGEGKTDGNPFEPLSDPARADMQAGVDRYYGMFTGAVAKGRGVPVETVRSAWKARVYGAKDAVEIGMADGVATLEEVVRRAARLTSDRAAVAASVDQEVDARRRARARSGA